MYVYIESQTFNRPNQPILTLMTGDYSVHQFSVAVQTKTLSQKHWPQYMSARLYGTRYYSLPAIVTNLTDSLSWNSLILFRRPTVCHFAK